MHKIRIKVCDYPGCGRNDVQNSIVHFDNCNHDCCEFHAAENKCTVCSSQNENRDGDGTK